MHTASHGSHRIAANRLATASPLVSRTRRATGSPCRSRRANRCARPTITAVSNRSLRLRVRFGSSIACSFSVSTRFNRRSNILRRAGVVAGPRRLLHRCAGQIASIQFGQVLHAILHMVQHLQRRAQRIGRLVGRAILAVQIEHMPSDRHRRITAIILQLIPVGIAQLGGVAPERNQQIQRMTRASLRSPPGWPADAEH